MSKFAFNRDNILSPTERVTSARKCLTNLEPHIEAMGQTEADFVQRMLENIDRYGVSERQLAWLRDLNEKY